MAFELIDTPDGSSTLLNEQLGESYKSQHGALSESDAVFWNPILERLKNSSAIEYNFLELGFGIGTNLRALIRHLPQLNAKVNFYSIEKDFSALTFYLEHQNDLSNVERSILGEVFTNQRLLSPTFKVDVYQGDFLAGLQYYSGLYGGTIDGILFDPFSPKSNPEAWTCEIFKRCKQLLNPTGLLATYSVARTTKDALKCAELKHEKFKLPKQLNKKEAIIAYYPN